MGSSHDLTSDPASTYDLNDPSLVSCLVSVCQDAELREVVAAWTTMPGVVRASIVVMARAITSRRGE